MKYRIPIVAGIVAILAALIYTPRHVDAQAAQLVLTTPATVTCDGSAHQFSTTFLAARWVQIIPAATGNSGPIRVGNSSTTTSRGLPIAGGGSFALPPMTFDNRESPAQHFYDLSRLYYACTNNDTFNWGYIQ